METDPLQYDQWIEDALRDVVRRALSLAETQGLPGDHHYYVTFRTEAEGVNAAKSLLAQHPDEMTIVLQHKYWDLTVGEDSFSVTLTFGGKPERLMVPFAAITSFADPAVNFGLQLKMSRVSPDDAEQATEVATLETNDTPSEAADDDSPEPSKSGEVIALDTFRKK